MKNFSFAGYDNVEHIGTNGKMTGICAAMVLTSLESMQHFIDVNRRNYEAYQDGMPSLPGVRLLEYDAVDGSNYQYVVVEVSDGEAGVRRDELMAALHAEGVLARRYFYPGCHRMEPYRSYFPNAGLVLRVTENICASVLVLPTGTAMDVQDVDRVVNVIIFSTRQVQVPRG